MQRFSLAVLAVICGVLLVALEGCGTIGYPDPGSAPIPIATLCSQRWVLLVNATRTTDCAVQLTAASTYQAGEAVWPDLLPGSDWVLSFTATVSDTSPVPADGFAVVLGDPALGATTASLGTLGSGLSARGIPGVVFSIDVYRNPDEPTAPYFGISRGELKLWENPFLFTNNNLPAIARYGATLSHVYVFTMKGGQLTMTLDSAVIFSGAVATPKMAYLYLTAATGNKFENVALSNLSLQSASITSSSL